MVSCIICVAGDGPRVDADLSDGLDPENIAKRYGLPADAVALHVEHVGAVAVRVAEESSPETLLAALRRNAARLESAILLASSEEDRTVFLRGSAELTKNLALQNQISNPTSTDEMSETVQIRSLARKMISAVSGSPEMTNALRKALGGLTDDDGDDAS